MSVVDVVLATLIFALVGWTLVQCGSRTPAKRGGGCGCSSSGCDPARGSDGEQLVTLPRAGESGPER